MGNTTKSSSIEHQKAEKVIFQRVKIQLGIDLEVNPKVKVGATFMQPDFYSKECGIIGEIFAHIGKFKSGQNDKIAYDILKMLLLEKIEGRIYRKMIAVCDEEEKRKLTGKGILAEAVRQFDIEVMLIDVGEDLKAALIEAQNRQNMVNA